MRNTFFTVLALAIAIASSPLSDLRAATFVSPSSRPETNNLTHVVKAKKNKKKSKHAKSKGPGTCGTYMYYSKKTHQCMDARAKK